MEKESVKDVFLRYGVLLGKRNTERQKTDFLRAAQKQLEQAGFPVDITCVSASLMRRESVNMYNLCCIFIHYSDSQSSEARICESMGSGACTRMFVRFLWDSAYAWRNSGRKYNGAQFFKSDCPVCFGL